MKIFLFSALIFLITFPAFSNQPASPGKILTKRLPSLSDNEQTIILITFTDKGNIQQYKSSEPQSFLSEKAIKRRLKVRNQFNVVDAQDYPVNPQYVRSIRNKVVAIRHELKWFNAVSAVATKKQIEQLLLMPFVKEIELVGKWKRNSELEEEVPDNTPAEPASPAKAAVLNYGPALKQLSQINVPAVHNLGIYGQGVMVGVFDNGFRLLTHQAFATMNIIAQYDFVDHKVSVIPNNTSTAFGSHGVNTLSTIGGYVNAQLIGPAFKSNFVLARTENDSSETPVEEDNWVKAIEWADSIGIDVASTSLGYYTYDAPFTSWTWLDMDGNTTLITKAADRAVGLGIVVLNSAGNDASRGEPNTLIGPADGDSVLAIGAVDSFGVRASFSSYGPSSDGRTKPDVMAMGVAVRVASSTNPAGYSRVNGTSFSCPLSAGVAALILCANPSLTPMQVREAMRQTANNAGSPNNLYGWGLLDALAAINYYGVSPFARISGTVFIDQNNNGVKNSGEPGIAGITIQLTGTSTDSAVTDSLGDYAFDSLATGSYTVSQDFPAEWIQTYPISGSHSVSVDSATANMSGNDFGGYQPGSIEGMVYNDLDSNTIKDLGEPPLADWKISLTGIFSDSTLTDAQGEYSFENLIPGHYTISESLKWGWVQTAPTGIHDIVLLNGYDTSGFDFGNHYAPYVTYTVSQGWNLLSLPLDVEDNYYQSLYFNAASKPFIYNGSYTMTDSVSAGDGYWLKLSSNTDVQLKGDARISDTLSLTQGWHMIGTPTFPVALTNIAQNPGGLIASDFFYYDGTYHAAADSLFPHKGYWVKASTNGDIILNTAFPNSSWPKPNLSNTLITELNSITIQDKQGSKQKLYFGNDESLSDRGMFELPPPAPGNVLDVRFSAGTFVGQILGNKKLTATLNGGKYPLTISWEINDKGNSFILTFDKNTRTGKSVLLTSTGSMVLDQPGVSILQLSQQSGASELIPEVFELKENYPNPFNPSTTISYGLPVDAFVKIQIFNLIGQQIATLVNTNQSAGRYDVTWNAVSSARTELPGGLYLYRLDAYPSDGSKAFTTMRKMVLIK